MNEITEKVSDRSGKRGLKMVAVFLGLLLFGGCTHMMMMLHGRVDPPQASEFGFGPRRSTGGLYEATIEPVETLEVRRMQTVKLTVRAAGGHGGDGDSA